MTVKMDGALMQLIASASLPFIFVEQPAFRYMMSIVAPQYKIRLFANFTVN
jgi:hypothetical protein